MKVQSASVWIPESELLEILSGEYPPIGSLATNGNIRIAESWFNDMDRILVIDLVEDD